MCVSVCLHLLYRQAPWWLNPEDRVTCSSTGSAYCMSSNWVMLILRSLCRTAQLSLCSDALALLFLSACVCLRVCACLSPPYTCSSSHCLLVSLFTTETRSQLCKACFLSLFPAVKRKHWHEQSLGDVPMNFKSYGSISVPNCCRSFGITGLNLFLTSIGVILCDNI